MNCSKAGRLGGQCLHKSVQKDNRLKTRHHKLKLCGQALRELKRNVFIQRVINAQNILPETATEALSINISK